MADVTVIIPARDAAATIGEVLGGLAQQDYPGTWETIVVNDGSSDDTAMRAAALGARVISGVGRGPAVARNAGAAASGSALLAFLDADCRPCPSWLQHGVGALADAELAQGATIPAPGVPLGSFDRTLVVTRAWGLYESANLFVRRELFERLGGFESWLGPQNGKELGEDVWFGWRARRLGARIAFCEEALVHHAVFSRGAGGYVAERARLRYFPAMASRIPELRDEFFYRGWFLTRRSAAFDLALAGCLAAGLTGQKVPLLATAAYVSVLSERLLGGGPRHAAKMLAVEVAADAVGLAALLRGSLEYRALLL